MKPKIKDASIGRLSSIYIAQTKAKGLGIFTNTKIKKGTVIEISPVIVMPLKDKEHLDKTLLHDYIFMWGKKEENIAMALGWIPLYNHNYKSNCQYQMNFTTQEMAIISVVNIAENEELTINYNGEWNDSTKVWFDVEE
jgi:SET domain-containing protein